MERRIDSIGVESNERAMSGAIKALEIDNPRYPWDLPKPGFPSGCRYHETLYPPFQLLHIYLQNPLTL